MEVCDVWYYLFRKISNGVAQHLDEQDGKKDGCDVVSWTDLKPPSRGIEVQLSLAIDKRDREI